MVKQTVYFLLKRSGYSDYKYLWVVIHDVDQLRVIVMGVHGYVFSCRVDHHEFGFNSVNDDKWNEKQLTYKLYLKNKIV
mgnify:CR=1 FL=1